MSNDPILPISVMVVQYIGKFHSTKYWLFLLWKILKIQRNRILRRIAIIIEDHLIFTAKHQQTSNVYFGIGCDYWVHCVGWCSIVLDIKFRKRAKWHNNRLVYKYTNQIIVVDHNSLLNVIRSTVRSVGRYLYCLILWTHVGFPWF